jgi:SAM-dependent methyltransferase
MHISASAAGRAFAELYGKPNDVVVDIGGRAVNGSLRTSFEERGMKFVCVDIEDDVSVDIVTKPGDKLPFDTESVDCVVSTSCFEHDPCFWITFKEMCRITKPGGYVYVNAPAYGMYHKYPGDNWRFFSDAAQALAHWSAVKYSRDPDDGDYPVVVHETFMIDPPPGEIWTDMVCVWRRVPPVADTADTADIADTADTADTADIADTTDTAAIVLSDQIRNVRGPLQTKLNAMGYVTRIQVEKTT